MRSLVALALGAVLLVAPAAPARAEPAPAVERRHAAYVELLGRGSLWGVGYDYQPSRWFAVGALASWFSARGEAVTSLSPYLGLYPLGHGRHRLFVHAGPLLVHKRTPSPVPEWDGASDTGVALEAAVGYELRGPLLVRGFAMVGAGPEGTYPWLGLSIGWAR